MVYLTIVVKIVNQPNGCNDIVNTKHQNAYNVTHYNENKYRSSCQFYQNFEAPCRHKFHLIKHLNKTDAMIHSVYIADMWLSSVNKNNTAPPLNISF
jgi:hypothetical protein